MIFAPASSPLVPWMQPQFGRGRKTSGFDPSAYGTVKSWWEFSSLSMSDGASISSCPDSGPNGLTLSSVTDPIFKTNIIDGQSVARFDGSTSLMEYLVSGGGDFIGQPSSYFVVIALHDNSAAGGESSQNRFISRTGGGRQLIYAPGDYEIFAGAPLSSGVSSTLDVFKLWSAIFNGSSSSISINGSSVATGNVGSQSQNGGIAVGGEPPDSAFAKVDIAEILIYDGLTTNQSAVESYFFSRYPSL